jgi:hypothetical protein
MSLGEYSIAAVVLLLFMVPVSLVHALTPLYFYVSIIIIIIIEWSPTSLTRFLWTISGLIAGFHGVNLKQHIQTTLYCFATR